MNIPNPNAAGVPEYSSRLRREVHTGNRVFEVEAAVQHDGRVHLSIRSRDEGGGVRSEIQGVVAPGDLAGLARVLGAELRGIGAWMHVPRQTYAQMVEEARQVHPKAYTPWAPGEDRTLLVRFREGNTIPAMSAELGRSPAAIRGRLELLGEVMPIRATGGEVSDTLADDR